jgi:hypothetical protein
MTMAAAQDNGDSRIDLAAALGAEQRLSTQCFRVYIPDKDRQNKEFGTQRKWVLEAIELLSEFNGGATAMPQVEGTWADEDGRLVWERPVVVYSYVEDAARFLANLPRIREFLHRLGRQTNQGEIAFEFGDEFYRIRTFDEK